MYDELVKRLREKSVFMLPKHGEIITIFDGDLMKYAADAIEEQNQTIDKLIKTNDRLRSQVRNMKSDASWDEDIRRGQVQGMW